MARLAFIDIMAEYVTGRELNLNVIGGKTLRE
jgi:hypothetical protein